VNTIRQQATVGLLMLLCISVMAETRYVDLNSPSPTLPYTNWLTAATNIQDAVDAAVTGDTVLVTDGVYETGGSELGGSNRVSVHKLIFLKSVNGPAYTSIVGHQEPGTTYGPSAMRCVMLGWPGCKLSGFTLTNGVSGVYAGGVRCGPSDCVVSNCVIVGNFGNLGGGATWGTFIDCTFDNNHALTNGGATYSGVLSNCTLSDNSAGSKGGGAYGGTLVGCILAGNSAGNGGGAYAGTLKSCILTRNSAGGIGGGAYQSVLVNCNVTDNDAKSGGGTFDSTLSGCIISGNSAILGGGCYWGTLTNCTVVGNTAAGDYPPGPPSGGPPSGGGCLGATVNNSIVFYNSASYAPDSFNSTLRYCCTPSASGAGNITNAPIFGDTNGWSNLHLQSNSPCINAGNDAYAPPGPDLDGNPRNVGGTVDIGAYEFQSPSSVLSYAWAQQYGLPSDGSADFTDEDSDGMNNDGEWRSNTNPTNDLSVLRMVGVTNSPSGTQVAWQSVTNRNYWLERATNLSATPSFQSLATNLPGVTGTKTYTDASATNDGPFFYRVGVQQ
jgi:predicted outer membrane repeat protein